MATSDDLIATASPYQLAGLRDALVRLHGAVGRLDDVTRGAVACEDEFAASDLGNLRLAERRATEARAGDLGGDVVDVAAQVDALWPVFVLAWRLVGDGRGRLWLRARRRSRLLPRRFTAPPRRKDLAVLGALVEATDAVASLAEAICPPDQPSEV